MDALTGPGKPTRARRAHQVLAGTALVILWAFLGATGVGATPNSPGNNGTLKVHSGDGEPSPSEVRNEPHVGCSFHLHGYHFDDNSTGRLSAAGGWRIESWPPTGNRSEVKSGDWTANGVGTWRTGLLTLPAGHYKAYAKQSSPHTPGGWKQKVFWVECGTTGGGNTGGGGNGGGGNGGGGNGGGGNVGGGGHQGGVKPATPPLTGGNVLGAGGGAGTTLPPTSTANDVPAQGTGSIWLVLIGLFLMGAGLFVLSPRRVKAQARS